MNSLRGRLFISHGFLVLVSMVLVGVVLFVFLRNTSFTSSYDQRLILSTLSDYRPGDISRQLLTDVDAMSVYLQQLAERTQTRVLLVSRDNLVELDTATAADDTVAPIIRLVGNDPQRGGSWAWDSQQKPWLMVSVPLGNGIPRGGHDSWRLLFLRRPTPVWRIFSESLLRPLIQASGIALLLALGLSAVLANSISQPIQKLLHATRRIGQGDYQQRVPVQGARELRELAQQFNNMTGQVAASQQAQRDFVANVSHELKTPLTSIQGFAQAIADFGSQDPQATQQYAHIIQTESARMERLVTQLLAIARWQAQPTLQNQQLDLNSVLDAVIRSQAPLLAAKNQSLDYQPAPHSLWISGDADRLRQVFTNLLANASQYTPTDGKIRLAASQSTTQIKVQIEDNGNGIAENDLPRIFERFYRADKARVDTGNAGLGLSIVQDIVQAHHGRIDVHSTLGKGSCFTVWLPLAQPNIHQPQP
jgi:signal transduction histidine kinase